MEPIFYVIAIMGCGDGSEQCAQARVEPTHYQSIRACQAAMAGALQRNSDLAFPVIGAACHASGRLLTERQDEPRRRG